MVAGTRLAVANTTQSISASNKQYAFTRTVVGLPDWDVTAPRFLIANSYSDAGVITANASTLTVEAMALEVNGVLHPITLKGSRSRVLASGEAVWTDALTGLTLTKNTTVLLRCAVFTATGGTRVQSGIMALTQAAEYTTTSSVSLAAAVDGVLPTAAEADFGHPPVVAMVGLGHISGPVALILGDSIARGKGFHNELADTRGNIGFMQAALDDKASGRIPSLNMTVASAKFDGFAKSGSGTVAWLKTVCADLGTVPFNCVISQLGVNALALGFSGLQDGVNGLRSQVNGAFGTLPFAQTTITPAIASAGNASFWTTEADQVYLSANAGPDPSARSRFNDWIKGNPGGIIGLDVSAAVSGASSSKFRVSSFSTQLASAITAVNSSYVLYLNDAPEVGMALVIAPGDAVNGENGNGGVAYVVRSVTGSGPYAVTIVGNDWNHPGIQHIARTHPAGEIVKQTYTADGIHPTTRGHQLMANQLIQLKTALTNLAL